MDYGTQKRNGFTSLNHASIGSAQVVPQESRRKRNHLMGFTLTEVVISLGIMMVLAAVVAPQYRRISRQFALSQSAYRLAQDLRRVQEMSISTRGTGLGIGPAGYGIYINADPSSPGFDNTRYILYADMNGSHQYEPSADTDEEITLLEKDVYIKTPEDVLSMNFQGPNPITRILRGGSEKDELEIVLSLDDLNRTIKINKAGLIYVVE